MKLLLVSVKSQVSYGGIVAWTDRFLQRIDPREMECVLVNTELVGQRATKLNARRNLWDEWIRTRRIFRQLKAALQEKPEIAYINTSCGTFGLFRDYMIASGIRRAGIRLITHYHCDIPYWIHGGIRKKYLGKLAQLSDCNLVLCQSSRSYLQNQCGAESVVLPSFVDDVHPGAPKQVRPKAETVLYVGRVEKAKGSRELYDTALRCPHLRFLVVGEISPDAKKWKVPENVELLGTLPHDRVLQLMDEADLFFFPSHSEGCSVALMEAAAKGLPMIATDVGANRDIVGKAGVVVAVGDVDAMVQATKTLQPQPLRQEMSRIAMENIQQNFSKDQLNMLFAHIRSLIEKE